MKIQTTYSLESCDGGALSVQRLEQAYNALQGYLTSEDFDRDGPHPGVKGLRRIRGNVFSRSDVEAFSGLVEELAERAERRLAELRRERDEVAVDGHSRVAYDGLIEMVGSARTAALADLASFVEAFEDEAAARGPVP